MRRACRALRLRRDCDRGAVRPCRRRRRRTASSRRSPTAAWSRSTPTAAGCAHGPCPTRDRSPSWPSRPAATGSRSSRRARSWVLDLASARPPIALTPGEGGATNPGWSLDGLTLAFRRGLFVYRVPAVGGTPQPDLGELLAGITDLAWMPDAKEYTPVVGGLLLLTGLGLPPAVTGLPAWAPDKQRGRVSAGRRALDHHRRAVRCADDRGRHRERAALVGGLVLARLRRRPARCARSRSRPAGRRRSLTAARVASGRSTGSPAWTTVTQLSSPSRHRAAAR